MIKDSQTLFNELTNKVAFYEGFRSHFYKDPVGYGTIGYGHRSDNPKLVITITQAKELLVKDLTHCLNDLANCDFVVQYHELLAIADLVFNVGISKFRNSNTYKLICAYSIALDKQNFQYAEKLRITISKAFLTWNHAFDKNGNKIVLDGLNSRCEFRRKLWLYGRIY